MDDNSSPKFLLYLRKSKGRAGISRQRTVTTGHITRLGGTIIGEYPDTDRTAFQRTGGKRPEREQFDAMLAALRTMPGVGVAAWHADRLLRNSGDTETLIEICAAGGHIVETPGGGSYALGTANGRKRLRDDATAASYEVDHAIERITAQKAEAAAEGRWLGGPVPFGWEKDGEGGLRLKAAEAGPIREAIRDVTAGVSLHAITRRWNSAGVLTKKGNRWAPQEVRRTLLRGRNAGLMEHQGKITGPGQWPAIVTEAEWRACRALLCDPARRTSPGSERRWLGSGLYLCGVCGRTMLVTLGGRPGRLRQVYRCAERKHVARDAASLDAFVRQMVIARLSQPDAALALTPHGPDASLLSTGLAAVRGELDDLAVQAGDGAISVRQMGITSRALHERAARLEAELARAAIPGPLAVFAGGDPAKVWDRLGLDRQRSVLAALLTVTVCPATRGRPPGWQPGTPYFDTDSVRLSWL